MHLCSLPHPSTAMTTRTGNCSPPLRDAIRMPLQVRPFQGRSRKWLRRKYPVLCTSVAHVIFSFYQPAARPAAPKITSLFRRLFVYMYQRTR